MTQQMKSSPKEKPKFANGFDNIQIFESKHTQNRKASADDKEPTSNKKD